MMLDCEPFALICAPRSNNSCPLLNDSLMSLAYLPSSMEYTSNILIRRQAVHWTRGSVACEVLEKPRFWCGTCQIIRDFELCVTSTMLACHLPFLWETFAHYRTSPLASMERMRCILERCPVCHLAAKSILLQYWVYHIHPARCIFKNSSFVLHFMRANWKSLLYGIPPHKHFMLLLLHFGTRTKTQQQSEYSRMV